MWRQDKSEREELWSPGMRKWMRGAQRHGKKVVTYEGGGVSPVQESDLPSLDFSIQSNSMYVANVM